MKLLILGGGAVVTEYYLPALHLLGKVSDVLIIEPSVEAIRVIAKTFPLAKCKQMGFKEYLEDFSAGDNFDAAIIALPNHLHAEAVAMALNKRLNVFCEKPLAMDERSCLRLGQLSKETGKILAVAMVRRLLPAVSALQEALKNGLIGNLQSIDIEHGNPYGWVSDSGSFFQPENGGVLTDIGVHYLDLVEELLGPLTPLSYQDDYKGGVEANLEFRLISKSGIPINLVLSRTHKLRDTAIFKGEYGELILEKETFDSCLWRPFSINNLIGRLYPRKFFQGGNWPADLVSCFAEQILEFQDAIYNKVSPRVTAHQATRTMQLVEWAYNNRQEKKIRSYSSASNLRPAMKPARIVITGGTGFIGGHLVSRLADLGLSEITVSVRNYKTCTEVARFPVKMPRVNLLDYRQVKAAIQGAQFVFHLAYGRDGQDAAAVTIKGTQNAVRAAIECRAECIVILSTMYVFGHPDTDRLVDESWPYRPVGGEYGISKARMEKWCLWKARQSPLTRLVVLGPSCVYGPAGKAYTQMPIQMARQGNFCWIEEGRGIANYTFVDNLIDAIILAATCKEAHGQRFIINDGFCPWRQFLAPLLGEFAELIPSFSKKDLVLKNRRQPVYIKDVIRHFAGDLELMDMINRMPLLDTTKRILLRYMPNLRSAFIERRNQKAICANRTSLKYPPEWLGELFGPTKTKFSSEKAKTILGWKPLVSLTEGQQITQAWLKTVGLL